MNEFKIINRGRGRVLLENGHKYHQLSVQGQSKRLLWRCAAYKRSKCCGMVTVSEDESVILKRKNHIETCSLNHKRQMNIVINKIVQEMTDGADTVPAAYKETVAELEGRNLVTSIPSFKSKESGFIGTRNIANELQEMSYLSNNVGAVVVPPQSSELLLADYNPIDGGSRILVFCSREARALIPNMSLFLCDGSSKLCPEPFAQVYTLYGEAGSTTSTINVVPLIYALLSDIKKETYNNLFRIIKSEISGWNPKVFITDFEEGIVQAISNCFPNAEQQGCYHQFTRKLWRKAKQLNLRVKPYRRIVQLCCVLPYLPEDYIMEGWEYVKAQLYYYRNRFNLLRFIHYMTFWMTPRRVQSWSTVGRHQTKNFAEAWQRAKNGIFRKRPATVLQFLRNLEHDASYFSERIIDVSEDSTKRNYCQIEDEKLILDCQGQLMNGLIKLPVFMENLR